MISAKELDRKVAFVDAVNECIAIIDVRLSNCKPDWLPGMLRAIDILQKHKSKLRKELRDL